MVACAPASVAEAEAQRDVSWLDANGSRDAMEALGRLADHEPRAASALAKRKGNADAYHAAWLAHTRGARWGDDMLHAALASPDELAIAVSELPSKDPRLGDFAEDLEKGIGSAAAEPAAAAVAVLASLGPTAKPQLIRLLDLETTRAVTCTGLASADIAADSRLALTEAAAAARSVPVCQKALFGHAEKDNVVLEWLGTRGEPAVLRAAVDALPCAKVAQLWDRSFASSRTDFAPLEPALTASAARCPQPVDAVFARALPTHKHVRISVLRAMEAESAQAERLEGACRQLPRLAHGRAIDAEVRALAERVQKSSCTP